MTEAAVVFDILEEELVRIDGRVDAAEGEGIRERWQFGRRMLEAQTGKQLPHGLLDRVSERTGKSRVEIQKRVQFARRFSTESELCNAVMHFRSWHAIVNDALPEQRQADAVAETPALPDGVYRTIVADPPWQYDNKSTRGAAEDHYPTMSVDELCALPVDTWAAEKAHLYLWTTNGFLREAFDVLDAWGFDYKTTLVWVKPQIGMGNYFRSSSEYVLFGVRGGLRTADCNQPNWFNAKRGRHSAKPGLFFDLVERASYEPFLEMFARDRRLSEKQWSYWGNEA